MSKRQRSRSLAIAAPAAITIGIMAFSVMADGDSKRPDAAPAKTAPGPAASGDTTMPPSKPIKVRVPKSSLCWSQNRHGQVLLGTCAKATPPLALQALPDARYRFIPNADKTGPGCLGIRDASREPGPVVYYDYCGDRGGNRDGEQFRLQPVTKPMRGYWIRPVHNDLCLGIAGDKSVAGAVVSQLPCDPKASSQVFQMDPG